MKGDTVGRTARVRHVIGVGIGTALAALAIASGVSSAEAAPGDPIPVHGKGESKDYEVLGGGKDISVTRDSFSLRFCDPEVGEAVNGIDAIIVDVSNVAKQATAGGAKPQLRLDWSAPGAGPVEAVEGAHVTLRRDNSLCSIASVGSFHDRSSLTVSLDADVKWAIVAPEIAAGATVSLHDVTP